MAATDVGPVAPPTVIPGDRKRQCDRAGLPLALDSSPARIERPGRRPESTGPAAGAGTVAGPGRQPAVDPRDRQPDLAVPLRPGTRGHAQRLRPARRAAQPSRAARLAGQRVRPRRVEVEADSPADPDLGHLPPGLAPLARRGPACGADRPGKPAPLEADRPPARCRGNPRRDPGELRRPRRRDGRAGRGCVGESSHDRDADSSGTRPTPS